MKNMLFLGIVLGLMASHATAEELAGLNVDRGYQRAGSDYTHFHAKNARHCARNCADEKRCKAFDFNRNDKTCWLKDRVPAKRYNSNVVTGKKPGHSYNYGGSDKIKVTARGYCSLKDTDRGRTLWETTCDVKQTVSANKQVFTIHANNGVKYKFVQKSGDDWQIKMGGGYDLPARFRDKGRNEGVFKWEDYKLHIWTEGR